MTINKLRLLYSFCFFLIASLPTNCASWTRTYSGTIEEYLNQEKKDATNSTSIPGYSDSLTLKNGQTITNVKTKIAGDSVVVDYPDGSTKVFKKAQVKAVNRN